MTVKTSVKIGVKGRIYDIFDTNEFADIYRILSIINEYTEDNIDNRVRGNTSEANVNYLNEAKDEFIDAYERLKKLIVSLDKKKIKTENTSFLYFLKGS